MENKGLPRDSQVLLRRDGCMKLRHRGVCGRRELGEPLLPQNIATYSENIQGRLFEDVFF